MEFHKKLQELRKRKNITQEELAQALYVSRTAVSKWESGRGYPNIDSLKAIAQFYGVTIDELLSSEEVLTIAEEDQKEKDRRTHDLLFGLLDLSVVLLFFLPLFGQQTDGFVQAVSLLSLTGIAPYMQVAYFAVVVAISGWGILLLALQNCQTPFWRKIKTCISCVLAFVGLLAFILGSQPYAAALVLLFLSIKILMLVKKQ